MNSTTIATRGATPILPSPWPLIAAGILGSALVGVLLARDTTFGVAAALGACYAPLAFVNLPVAVALWIPLAFVSHAAVAGPAPTLVLILLVVAWFGALPAARGHAGAALRRHPGMFALLGALQAWLTASLIWAGDTDPAVGDLWRWLLAAVILVLVATTIGTRRDVVLACWGFVFGALLSVGFAFVQGTETNLGLATQEEGRLGTSGPQDPNFLAAAIVPAAVIAAGLAAHTRSVPARTVLLGTIAVLAVGLIATGSRGGIIASVVAIAAAIVLARGRRMQIGGLIAIIAAVVGAWIVTSSPETVDRVKDFESGQGRVDLWEVALRMGGDQPVTGVGLNNFRSESARYVLRPGRIENREQLVDEPHVVHNLYLQQFAETGAVGIGLLLAFVTAGLAATWSAARRFERLGDTRMTGLTSAVLVAQVGFLSASLFLSNGYDHPLWILFALGPALTSVAAREAREND